MERMAISKSLQEVVLVEHFGTDLPLNVLDVASWAKEFSDFPVAKQLSWLPRVQLPPPGPFAAFGVMAAPGAELPRVLLQTADLTHSLQLQSDRLGFGWSRPKPVGEDADYPGFDALQAEFVKISRRFRTWCSNRLGLEPRTRVVELVYNNAAPLVVGEKVRRISEVFKFVQPGRPVNGFQVVWTELIDKERLDGARVNAAVALGSAPPIDRVLIHNFSGLAPVDGDTAEAIQKGLQLLHQHILEMYKPNFDVD